MSHRTETKYYTKGSRSMYNHGRTEDKRKQKGRKGGNRKKDHQIINGRALARVASHPCTWWLGLSARMFREPHHPRS